MDGVICNFIQGIIDTHKFDIEHDEYVKWNYHRDLGLSDEEFWKPTDRENWWLELPPYRWADTLISELSVDYSIIFCTSPSLGFHCPSEKVQWLRDYGFMRYGKANYQIGPKKELNAKSGAILIDDSDENVLKYREAGGNAILFPQPWNMNAPFLKQRISYTLKALDDFRAPKLAL